MASEKIKYVDARTLASIVDRAPTPQQCEAQLDRKLATLVEELHKKSAVISTFDYIEDVYECYLYTGRPIMWLDLGDNAQTVQDAANFVAATLRPVWPDNGLEIVRVANDKWRIKYYPPTNHKGEDWWIHRQRFEEAIDLGKPSDLGWPFNFVKIEVETGDFSKQIAVWLGPESVVLSDGIAGSRGREATADELAALLEMSEAVRECSAPKSAIWPNQSYVYCRNSTAVCLQYWFELHVEHASTAKEYLQNTRRHAVHALLPEWERKLMIELGGTLP